MWVTRTYLTLSIRKKMEVKTGYAMYFKTSDEAKTWYFLSHLIKQGT